MRHTRFVPRVVFRTAFAGVVPVCVVAASSCGGRVEGNANSTENCPPYGCASVGITAFSPDACPPGYQCGSVEGSESSQSDATLEQPGICDGVPCGSVGVMAFAGDVAAMAFGVANMSFQGDGGTDGSDAALDSGEAQEGSPDAGEPAEGPFGDAGLDAPDGD